ncbi:hypothetical protein CJF32_00001460 [Rutstroemia sp. NJR-2017a WRK4]|nr:hypothetical protein CJF32_00001460 [Rutstroemia sp. NJR-2017a WRK4]
MSKARDIFPLFLATVFGIGSSVWTFGPALKEQREQKDEELRKALANPVETPGGEALRQAEVVPNRAAVTEAPLQPTGTSNSWSSSLGLWSSAPDSKRISTVKRKDDGSYTRTERDG